ncbi:ABC transporter ATP-binding protein [uncultured Parvimonas sp.]|uniref:ATP-binding cassette domain-containing protein n=1 Tax=uncultured Parvimonas sp. TaxID=747372 RepID=UPI00259775D8|nr:ABC transporter ATP-binding protein [uncultured Parvimonas sp.]
MNSFLKNLSIIFDLLFKKSLLYSVSLIVTYLMQVVISFLYVYSINEFFQSIYIFYMVDKSKILNSFLLFAFIVLLKHIVDGINVFTINTFNKKIVSVTKFFIIEKMNNVKYSNFENVDKLNFIDSIKNVRMDSILIFYLSMFFYYIPYSLVLVFYLYKINYVLAVAGMFLFLPILCSKIFQIKYSDSFEEQVVNIRRKFNLFIDYFFEISILRDIKSFCAENYFINLCKFHSKKYVDERYNFQKKILKMEIVFKSIVCILFGIIVYILINLIFSNVINVATFSSTLIIISELISASVNLIVYDSELLVENYSSFKNYFKLYLDESYFDYINKEKESSLIKFENVNFSYINSKIDVLKNLNFSIKNGEKVAIIGKNGSGKSSLFKLLTGLYYPTKGKISNISNNSVVFQDYCKYKLNLKENIILSDTKKDFDLEKFDNIFNLTGLSEKFDDTNVELSLEFNGITPSGGMWNNISIARCLYKDAELFLMDEPMSNFDSIKEKEIFDKLIEYFKDKTLIFTTHNLGIAKKFDKIILVDNGEIVAVGNHKILMKNSQLYKELFETQKEMYE